MNSDSLTPETLSSSVIAVPPLARNDDLSLNRDENTKLIRHIESGGVTTLLYGGNAILYHVAVSEYADLLELLAEAAGDQTRVIPSVGPGFGTMMDQAAILLDMPFPTSMILPSRDVTTSDGVASAVRRFVEFVARPAVLYIKHDDYVEVDTVKRLMDDKLLSWIKYAVVRDNPADDPWLRRLVDAVGSAPLVSGIGEQPAITHMQQFGLAGFTSGCVCVAPRLSMQMLAAVHTGDLDTAERIRNMFYPLEELRNSIHPVRVLHAAVELAGIANTGPVLPLLSEISETERAAVQQAARTLLHAERAAATAP